MGVHKELREAVSDYMRAKEPTLSQLARARYAVDSLARHYYEMWTARVSKLKND